MTSGEKWENGKEKQHIFLSCGRNIDLQNGKINVIRMGNGTYSSEYFVRREKTHMEHEVPESYE